MADEKEPGPDTSALDRERNRNHTKIQVGMNTGFSDSMFEKEVEKIATPQEQVDYLLHVVQVKNASHKREMEEKDEKIRELQEFSTLQLKRITNFRRRILAVLEE